MISLYKVVGTVEAYVLAESVSGATDCVRLLSDDRVAFSGVDASIATEVSQRAERRAPIVAMLVEPPRARRQWTCAEWAAALPGDVAAEAARLREEAAKAEATMASLRAKAEALEALAQPKALATRDPALDGDAKTTTGPREDFAPLHPDMFGGTDYPEVKL